MEKSRGKFARHRIPIIVFLVVLALSCVGLWRLVSEEPSPKKNIIMVAMDTLRADHLHAYGYEYETSPNIDQFAEESIKFSRAISVAPWTLPSFASVMTSLYPSQHGAGASKYPANVMVDNPNTIRSNLITLAGVLTHNAYEAHGIYTNSQISFSLDEGFDTYELKLVDAEILVNEAISVIEKRKHKPFFLFVQFLDCHEPYCAPEPYFSKFLPPGHVPRADVCGQGDYWKQIEKHDIRGDIVSHYDGTISYFDAQFGRFLDYLKEKDLYDNSIIVLFSDHGDAFFDHEDVDSSKYPYLGKDGVSIGHGKSLYNELLHVPLILHAPNLPEPQEINTIVELIDIAPTVLDLNEIPVPEQFKGRSLVPLLDGRAEPGKEVDRSYQAFSESIAYGIQRYMFITDGYKLIYAPDIDYLEVYDINNDWKERDDLQEGEISSEKEYVKEELSKILSEKSAGQKIEYSEQAKEALRALGYLK